MSIFLRRDTFENLHENMMAWRTNSRGAVEMFNPKEGYFPDLKMKKRAVFFGGIRQFIKAFFHIKVH